MAGSNENNETDEIAFHEEISRPASRTTAVRLGIVAGSALLFVIGAVAVMGASPAPTTGADPAATTAPGATESPEPTGAPGTTTPGHGGFGRGGFGPGAFGGIGFGSITIRSISGSDITLNTEDGWSRTITVTSATKITRGGATIGVTDLAAGDKVRFSEQKAADGSYTITAIEVVLPTIAGQVTGINGDTITVTQPGGTTATIHVGTGTTYQVDGATGSLSGIKVGSFVVAEGTQRADGSLDAAAIRAGFGGGIKGPGAPGHDGPGDTDASPAPSSPAS